MDTITWLLDADPALRWQTELGGKPFFDGETEPCINGGALAAGAYFGYASQLEYERAVGATPVVAAARRRAEEYLLERRLFRGRRSGEVVDASFLELGFPPRYCDVGLSIARSRSAFRFRSRRRWASPAAGTRCARYACCAGSRRTRRLERRRSLVGAGRVTSVVSARGGVARALESRTRREHVIR